MADEINGVVHTKDSGAQPENPLDVLIKKIKPSSFGLQQTHSTIDISADKWLLVNDEASLGKLENPPSLAHGLSREIERDIRYLGCELIQSGAILLKIPQTAAATGQILFHRFYYQKSFVRYNFEHTVMACLLLASKIEEEPRRPRDVFHVYNRLKEINCGKRRNANDSNYKFVKAMMIKAERRILNTLGFVVHVHHPHKLIYVYLHSLKLLNSTNLLQKAWSYMNDGLRTDIFLRYRPETIACACIHLAAKTVDVPVVLPKTPFPWFELFDVSDRDVKMISMILMELYNKTEIPKLNRLVTHVEKLSNNMNKNGVKNSKLTTTVDDENKKADAENKVIQSVQEKFDAMKEYQEKKFEKRRQVDRHEEPRERDKDKDRRRHDRNDKERKRSRSPKKISYSRSRSPNYKKYKHDKHPRKHRAY